MQLRILRSAFGDLDQGRAFYAQHGEELGDYFLDSLFTDIESLVLYAGIHVQIWGFHRMLSRRFPYAIYYKLDADVWVLRSRYEMAKADMVTAFSALLDTADLTFEDEPSVETAVYSWKDSAADFADCLIEARNRRLGCRATATFDVRALKLAGFISV